MRHRTGLLLLLGGILLAGLTTLLVIRIARQATEAGHATLRQVSVVTAKRDLVTQTVITADALLVKPFPADFVPSGAFSNPDDLVGKLASGFIPKDQVVVAGQIMDTPRSQNLSDRVPPGKVVVWLPMPVILVGANVLRLGDHLDILLSVCLGVADGSQASSPNSQTSCTPNAQTISTQTTLQNVEVFRLGDDERDLPPSGLSTPSGQTAGASGQSAPAPKVQSGTGAQARPIGFLVDHQDAVMIKFVKDAGGTIDLVTRSSDEQQVVRTEAMTLDSLADRFRFRVPLSVTAPQPLAAPQPVAR